ncbi:MAG TPA: MFS transporter [Patescibacteria group bacterium]|nr:MFS transporter [Patescibacteria group bacterium]
MFTGEFLLRFAFWTIQSTIILYFSRISGINLNSAYAIFGSFTALSFIMPILGGLFRNITGIGFRILVISGLWVVLLGAILLVLQLNMGLTYLGLTAIAVGAGLYLPNATLYLGELFTDQDKKKIRGFAFIYLSSNIAGVTAPIISGIIIQHYNWAFIFIPTVLGILVWLGLVSFTNFFPKKDDTLKINLRSKILFLGLLLSMFVFCYCDLVFAKLMSSSIPFIVIFFIILLIYIISKSQTKHKINLIRLLLLSLLVIVYYAFLYQLQSSLLVFIKNYVNLDFYSYSLPANVFVSFEPAIIILIFPIVMRFLNKIVRQDHYLSNPTGIIVVGGMTGAISFLVFYLIITFNIYTLHSALGILFVGTIGLAIGDLMILPAFNVAIVTYSPLELKGLIVGLSSLPFAFSGYLSSQIARIIQLEPHSTVSNLSKFSVAYLYMFLFLIVFSSMIGFIVFSIKQKFNRIEQVLI